MLSSMASIAITLGITIPRVPAFSFSNDTPLANATGSWENAIPTEFSRYPANFSFPAYAALQVDTTGNFIPLTFTRLRANVYDLQTNMQVGTGDLGRTTFQPKALTNFLLPLNFTYIAINDSDQTCKLIVVRECAAFICYARGELVQCMQEQWDLQQWE